MSVNIIDFALTYYQNPLAYQDCFPPNMPLPDEMNQLLRLANGSPILLEDAIRQSGKQAKELQDAARFLIQQLCLGHGTTYYQVLGVESNASPEQMKEHHRLLMRLFHPDRHVGHETWGDGYAARINEAWTILSQPESRTAYNVRLLQATQIPYIPETVGLSDWKSTRFFKQSLQHSTHFRPRTHLAFLRRWLPHVTLTGVALVSVLAIWSVYTDEPSNALDTLVYDPSTVTRLSYAPTPPRSDQYDAIGSLMVTPHWEALKQRNGEVDQNKQSATDVTSFGKTHSEHNQLEESFQIEWADIKQKQTWKEQIKQHPKVKHERQKERFQVKQKRQEPLKQSENEKTVVSNYGTKNKKPSVSAPKINRFGDWKLNDLARHYVNTYLYNNLDKLIAFISLNIREKSGSNYVDAQEKQERLQAERLREEQERLQAERLREKQEQLERLTSGKIIISKHNPPKRVIEKIPSVTASRKIERLENWELDDLVRRYTNAYLHNNLDAFMALFTSDVQGKNGSNRADIRRDYTILFRTWFIQYFRLKGLRWKHHAQSATATGRYKLVLLRRIGNHSRQLVGSIHFGVRKQNGKIFIQKIDYDWSSD